MITSLDELSEMFAAAEARMLDMIEAGTVEVFVIEWPPEDAEKSPLDASKRL